MFSGVTDCYQPAERKFQLTRQCLELLRDCKHPASIVTKNALIGRDIDVLAEMAGDNLIHAFVSATTLDPELARDMEPRTSIPGARLRAIEMLVDAGIPVGVMVAPVIPGLNDSAVPAILDAAKQAGAMTASYVMLRLPLTVEPVFNEWVERTQPLKAERILNLVRQTRGGELYHSKFGQRMTGTGQIADQIKNMFSVFKKKCGLHNKLPKQDCSLFVRPTPSSGQMRLF